MEREFLTVEKDLISLNPEVILALLGGSEDELTIHSLEIIEKYISQCKEIMSPKGVFAVFEAVNLKSEDMIGIEGTTFHIGKIIKNMLRNSESYALFAVTAGPEIENMAKSLLEGGQFLEGYIVDLIGSGIVESAADQLHRSIKQFAERGGINASNRYSPGYCSWNVVEQQKLFRHLPDGCCGIALSESSMMTPIKSISGIVGLGYSVRYQDYTCEICSLKDCIFRKIRN